MLESLTTTQSQQIAEALLQELMENITQLDPAVISEVLLDGMSEDYVQDLVAALVGIETHELPSWVEEALVENDLEEP
jgi:hypothetical protein